MFVDDTKIFLVIRNSEDYAMFQDDMNSLYKWLLLWQLNFNTSKCKHLHFGPGHHYGCYTLNGTAIDSMTSHKDLGILFDSHLRFHDHPTDSQVTAKANQVLGMIKKSFEYLDSAMLTKLFIMLV